MLDRHQLQELAERVAEAWEVYLGTQVATERARNAAQALIYLDEMSDDEVEEVFVEALLAASHKNYGGIVLDDRELDDAVAAATDVVTQFSYVEPQLTGAQWAVLRELLHGGVVWHSSGAISSWSGRSAWLVPANQRQDARRVRMTTLEALLEAHLIESDPGSYPDVACRLTTKGRRAARSRGG